MKKLFVIAMAAMFALALTACGSSASSSEAASSASASAESASASAAAESASASAAAIPALANPVAAVFVAPDKQKFTTASGEEITIPTLWVYFADGTFEQYANIDGEDVLFSAGDYKIDGSFDTNGSTLTLHRVKKYDAAKGLAEYDSTHDYKIGELGFTPVFLGEAPAGKPVAAVFISPDKQKFTDASGTELALPTLWVYYGDGTFEQYATIDGADVLFSSGDYTIDGSFDVEGSTLTLHRTQKYDAAKGLADYDSTHDYKMGELGFTRILPTPSV